MEYLREIIMSFSALIAVVSTTLLFLNFKSARVGRDDAKANQKLEGTSNFNMSWQTFNAAVLSDPDLLDFDLAGHPFGVLKRKDIKKIYYYFMRFNVAYSAFLGAPKDALSDSLAESALANVANVSFVDRKFIKTHVFPRGYDRDFWKHLEDRWQLIEKTGCYLLMKGSSERIKLRNQHHDQIASGSDS